METSEQQAQQQHQQRSPAASSSPEQLDQETDFVLVPTSLASDSSRNKNANTG
jgi:hypothetical protein